MRGNGLEATTYVAIADLDPRVADDMLEVLREAGVAAYAEPRVPQQGLLLEVTLPPAPLDRLHVDRGEAIRARRLLHALLAESPGGEESDSPAPSSVEPADNATDDDQVWASLVEAYEKESKDPVGPWPTSEDTDDSSGESRGVKTKDGAETDDESGEPGESTAAAPAADADRFVPPPPPPLPRLDPITKLCWAVLVAGPVLMLLATFASGYVPAWFLPLGVVAFVGGFVLLVFRMRGGPPDETDDGAVV